MTKRVSRGDKITPSVLTANSWNKIADAAEAFAAIPADASPSKPSKHQTVMVRNEDDEAMSSFSAAVLGDPIIKPKDGASLGDFIGSTVFSVSTPDPEDLSTPPAVIVQEPIGPGKIGKAIVFGTSPIAKLKVESPSHTRARVGSDGELISSEDGPAVILWKGEADPDSTAARVGVVTLVQASTGPVRAFGRIDSSNEIEPDENKWEYDFTVVDLKVDGTWEPRLDPDDQEITGMAKNTLEAGNSSSGIQGNGVDVANIPDGFEIVPIGDGAIVELRFIPGLLLADPGQWVFTQSNLVDGICEAQ